MKRWEYNWVSVRDENVANTLVILDNAGNEGWEFTGHTEDTGYSTQYMMKRRII